MEGRQGAPTCLGSFIPIQTGAHPVLPGVHRESGCVTRSRYPDVVLDASSVDVLVEAALRVARIERRRVALQDIEAVGGVRIARINARYEVPGDGPGHVDAAGHGRDVDVVAPEADHSSAMRFPGVVAREVADPRLGPAGAAIARLGDEGVDRPTRVPAIRRISGWPVRGVARVVSRVVEDDGDDT